MARRHTSLNKNFLLLIPILALIGVGIFRESVKRLAPAVACGGDDYSGVIDTSARYGFFNGERINIPESALADGESLPILGVADPSARWIEVDLSEQKLKAWDGNQLFLETAVSSGLPWWPTPKGEFRIWAKLRAAKMEGGQGRYYYYLPNVPYIMYFENSDVAGWRGFSLHGTYWHNAFGTPRSHGCVNLPTSIAEKLYYWVTPVLPDGKGSVFSSPSNTGTRVVVHE